jgi:hypothetical protein
MQTAHSNKLEYITDSYGEKIKGYDLQTQGTYNFTYSAIGEMTQDLSAGIDKIEWSVYGKRSLVRKIGGSYILYGYDAANNRVHHSLQEGNTKTEKHYIRDAGGNTLAIYHNGEPEERSIYGSSRIGSLQGKGEAGKRKLGLKQYEMSNHLGNVLATFSDLKFTTAFVLAQSDYLPFGTKMEGRIFGRRIEAFSAAFHDFYLWPITECLKNKKT